MRKVVFNIMIIVCVILFVIVCFFVVKKVRAHIYEQIAQEELSYCGMLDEEYNIYTAFLVDDETMEGYVDEIKLYVDKAIGYNKDYRIILTNQALRTTAEYAQSFTDDSRVYALTKPQLKIIYVNYHVIDCALLHEIGHTIDYVNDKPLSDGAEFQSLFQKVQNENNYFTNVSVEYFADCYQKYCLGELEDEEVKSYFDRILDK